MITSEERAELRAALDDRPHIDDPYWTTAKARLLLDMLAAVEAERDDLQKCYESGRKCNDDMERAMLAAEAERDRLREACEEGLLATIAKLREALRPFATYADTADREGWANEQQITHGSTWASGAQGIFPRQLTAGDCRKAKESLGE